MKTLSKLVPAPVGVWLPLVLVPLLVPIATSNTTLFGAQQAITSDGTRAIKMVVLGVLALAATIGWLLHLRRTDERVMWHTSLWSGLGLLGLAAWSTLASTSPAMALVGSYQYRQGLIAILTFAIVGFLVAQRVGNGDDDRPLAAAVAMGAIPVAVYALLQVAKIDPATWNAPAWAYKLGFATLGNPDALGGYLVLPAALALGLALRSERPAARAGWWAVFGLTVTTLLLTQIRAAWLGMLVAGLIMVAFMVVQKVRLNRVDAIAIGLAVVLLFAAGVWKGDQLAERIDDLFAGQLAGSGRLPLWESGARTPSVSPLLGAGPDSFRYSFYAVRSSDHVALGGHQAIADDAHMLPIQIAATLGIPALLLALVLFGTVLLRAARTVFTRSAPAEDRAPPSALYAAWLAAVVGHLVYLMLGPSSISSTVILAMALGVLVAPNLQPMKQLSLSGARGVAFGLAVVGVIAAVTASAGFVGETYHARALRATTAETALALEGQAVSWSPWTYQYRLSHVQVLADIAESEETSEAAMAAIQAYDDLIAFAPAEYLTYVNCARSLLGFKQLGTQADELALQISEAGLPIYPNGLDLRLYGATAALRLQQYDKAVELLDGQWDTVDYWADPGLTFGYALLASGQAEAAASVADELERRYSGDERVQRLRDAIAAPVGGS